MQHAAVVCYVRPFDLGELGRVGVQERLDLVLVEQRDVTSEDGAGFLVYLSACVRKTKVDVGRLGPSLHGLAVCEEVEVYLKPKLDGQIEKAEGCHGLTLRR